MRTRPRLHPSTRPCSRSRLVATSQITYSSTHTHARPHSPQLTPLVAVTHRAVFLYEAWWQTSRSAASVLDGVCFLPSDLDELEATAAAAAMSAEVPHGTLPELGWDDIESLRTSLDHTVIWSFDAGGVSPGRASPPVSLHAVSPSSSSRGTPLQRDESRTSCAASPTLCAAGSDPHRLSFSKLLPTSPRPVSLRPSNPWAAFFRV